MAAKTTRPTPQAGQPPAAAEGAAARPDEPLCPYCRQPCAEIHQDPFFLWRRCTQAGCGYEQKVPRPQLARRLRREAEQADHSAR